MSGIEGDSVMFNSIDPLRVVLRSWLVIVLWTPVNSFNQFSEPPTFKIHVEGYTM